jgi:hypothetical protein
MWCRRSRLLFWLTGLTVLLVAGRARAGVEAWRVNEVGAEPRFVELYAPPSASADNCFFPTTSLEIFDGAGVVQHTLRPFHGTTCYQGDFYFVFAPTGGDSPLPYPLDPAGGQVCFGSSGIRYDCVRWGAISVAISDQDAPGDASAAPALVAGTALARVGDTGVVGDDFVLQEPTPRGPNDGGVWTPPDAGPPPPDAAPVPDATPVPDAGPDARVLPIVPDARAEPPVFLNAEPGGGGCGCAVAGRGSRANGAAAAWLLAALGGLGLAYQRRHQRRRRHRP